MKLTMHNCNEDDFFHTRNFLREVFLLNDRLGSVPRLDYWRWHFF